MDLISGKFTLLAVTIIYVLLVSEIHESESAPRPRFRVPPAFLQNQTQRTQQAFREGRLILPRQGNNGVPLDPIRDQLEKLLLISFGGFTSFEGMGGWDAGYGSTQVEVYHSPVWIYDIGAVDNAETDWTLRSIAGWIKVAANQEAVYLRLPSGAIIFV